MNRTLLLFLAILVAGSGFGQSSNEELKLVNKVYALTNATIVQKPGSKLEGATLVLRDGLVESIGTDVNLPSDAQIIKADSMYVYAGFIDGMSKAGLKKVESSSTTSSRGQRPPAPKGPLTNKQSGITPEVSVLDQIDTKSSSIGNLRKMGFTAAHVVPNGQMLPGTGALLLLGGPSVEAMRITENASMFSQFRGANRVFPATIIGVMSKFRDVYHNASLSQTHEKKYQTNPAGMKRPMHDEAISAMFPVVNKQMPVFFHTESVLEAHRAIALQKELGFDLVLANLQQGWPIVDQIKQSITPVFLSLEMPKEEKEEKKNKDEEAVKPNPEKDALKARKSKSVKEYESQAATFAKANIPFGFSSYSVKSSDIKKNLIRMIKAGLSEDEALAALTTNPAQMLGVSNRLGSIDPGKIANLVISTGPYFDEKSQVKYVFVDGQKFEYEVKAKKEKKKPDGDASEKPAKITGKWNYILEVPQQTVEGTITLKNEDGDITGKITNPQMGDEARELDNFEFDKNLLSFDMDFEMGGQNMTLTYDLEFEEDSFSGTVSVGTFGTFDIEGERVDP